MVGNESASVFAKRVVDEYDAEIEIIQENNQFITQLVVVKNKNQNGLTFEVGFNSVGQASILKILGFKDAKFNIAEEFSSEQILEGASRILAGEYELTKSKILRRDLLVMSAGQVLVNFQSKNKLAKPFAPYNAAK